MKQQHLKKLHDRMISYFGLNKDRLMAYLCHLDMIKNMDADICVWPTETTNINAKGWQMGIFMRDTYGPTESGICFKDSDKKECMKVCMHINEQIFGHSNDDVLAITTSNRRNQQSRENENFDKALANIVSLMQPEQILSIPGCYEAISEQYNNAAMDVIESYNADPGANSLDLKYTIREVLQIMVNDLAYLTHISDELDLTDSQRKQFKQAENSVKLGRDYLKNLQHILDSHII